VGGGLLGVVDGLDEVVVVDVDVVVVDVEVLLLCCHFFFLLPVLLKNKLEQRWQGSSLFLRRTGRERKKFCFLAKKSRRWYLDVVDVVVNVVVVVDFGFFVLFFFSLFFFFFVVVDVEVLLLCCHFFFFSLPLSRRSRE